MNKTYIIVTVDTEEEKFWGTSYPRSFLPVKNIEAIPFFQNICDRYAIKPTYLTAYTVAKTPGADDILKPIEESGRGEIGGHLHPWNTPPFEEANTRKNSLMCHLNRDLLEQKLETLIQSHEEAFGKRPVSFRAGRWGFNEKVAQVLDKKGFEVDSSICPFIDCQNEGIPLNPKALLDYYWLDSNNVFRTNKASGRILEVPASVGFNRSNFDLMFAIHTLLKKSILKKFRLLGILSRLSILKLIILNPEFSDYREMVNCAKIMKKRGAKILNVFFHSSDLIPGNTPYVKNTIDLDNFIHKLEDFFAFIQKEYNAEGITLRELVNVAEKGEL